MSNATNNYTRWWWLRLDQMISWSADEWKAFAALIVTCLAQAAVYAIMGLRVTIRIAPSFEASVLLAAFVALAFSFIGLRSMTAIFFKNTIVKGDDAAASRMKGTVFLPTNETWIKATWWINYYPIGGTTAQVEARRRMLPLSLLFFLLGFCAVSGVLMIFGVSERTAALVAFVTTVFPAFYSGRCISVINWPDLIKRGDEDAIAQENRSVPPRI
jgi:hypothetical protein